MRIRIFPAGVACLVASLSLPAAAQNSNPEAGTALDMRPVTVQGQHQLRGRFGDKWTEDEVRARAAATCAQAGMAMVYFKTEAPDARNRRAFAAVCQ